MSKTGNSQASLLRPQFPQLQTKSSFLCVEIDAILLYPTNLRA